MSETPQVSVIMPNYNGARFIADSIQGVIRQTMPNWELLVIDDGSTDRSLEIIHGIADKDRRVRPLKTTFPKLSKGPSAARNTGIQEARGRYIAFCDSDDVWLPGKLAEQVAFMQANDYPFTFTWYDVISETGSKVGERKTVYSSLTYRQLLRDCIIGCLTAMYDTNSLGKQYITQHPLECFGDGILWLKILKVTPRAYCLPKILARYRLVTGSVSANKLDAAKNYWHLLTKGESLGLLPAIYYFTWYATKGVLLKLKYLIHRGGSHEPSA